MSDVYEERITHQVTLKESGIVEVRRTTQVYKNGVVFGPPQHHRTVATPDHDLSALPLVAGALGEEALVALPEDLQAVINAHWSPARRARYAAAKKAIIER